MPQGSQRLSRKRRGYTRRGGGPARATRARLEGDDQAHGEEPAVHRGALERRHDPGPYARQQIGRRRERDRGEEPVARSSSGGMTEAVGPARSCSNGACSSSIAHHLDEQLREVGVEPALGSLPQAVDHVVVVEGLPVRPVRLYQEAAQLARELENKGREAIFLGLIGQVKAQQQHLEDAAIYAEQAYQLAKESGDDYVLNDVLGQISYVAHFRGETEKSKKLFRESLELLGTLEANQKIGRLEAARDKFYTLFNLSETEYKLGNYTEALAIRERALNLAKEQNNQIWMAHAYYGIGEIQCSAECHESARENLYHSLHLFEQNNAIKDAGDSSFVHEIEGVCRG